MRDTVQAKLIELGLLRPDSSAGWQLSPQGREKLSAMLINPETSPLLVELLKLGVIESAPVGCGIRWRFTPQGRRLMTYLAGGNSPAAQFPGGMPAAYRQRDEGGRKRR